MSPFRPARSLPLTPTALRAHLAQPKPLPLHLPKLIDHWPALRLWSLDDGLQVLRDGVGEEREVEIELGRKGRGYLDEGYQRVSMGFGLFLDAFILSRIPSSSSSSASLPSAYLAQSDLLDSSPLLQSHVPPLEHYSSGPVSDIFRRTMWIGPGGSWTPFHRDPYVGIYSQILGSKTFHILPPSASRLLKPSPIPRYKNTSTIPLSISALFPPSPTSDSSPTGFATGITNEASNTDIDSASLAQYRSDLTEAAELEGACKVEVKAGESVLVPEGWWHAAEGGEGAGVGVGAWFR